MKTHRRIVHDFAIATITLISLALPSTLASQTASTPIAIEGSWQGKLGNLRLVLTISQSAGGKYTGSLESVDQGATLAMSNIRLTEEKVHFEIKDVGGIYDGTRSRDGKLLSGIWQQTGVPKQSLNFTWSATPPKPAAPAMSPAIPPVSLADLQSVLDKEFAPVLEHGVLAKSTGGGIVIGVYDHGQTKIFAYGTAQPDSIFEIGSVTKTFTALILAQMVEQKKIAFDDPVEKLLPAGTNMLAKPAGVKITLLDLATQHSGLPRLPDNLRPANLSDPYADYHAAQLYKFLGTHGFNRPNNPEFLYSNLGFGLLGHALTLRAGVTYEEIVKNEITGPLHMNDTFITPSPSQQRRVIQGHDIANRPAGRWTWDALAGAGALLSTASDVLIYLEANLRPEKLGAVAPADSPSATLPAAISLTHIPRANGIPGTKIGLAWFCNEQKHNCFHDGGTGGFTSFVYFSPTDDQAIVVLYNRGDTDSGDPFVDRVFGKVTGLLSGEPTPKLDK